MFSEIFQLITEMLVIETRRKIKIMKRYFVKLLINLIRDVIWNYFFSNDFQGEWTALDVLYTFEDTD